MLFDHVKAHYFYLWEFIFEEQQDLEFIFEEKGLFETSENKNPSKITSCTVIQTLYILINNLISYSLEW